MDFNEYQEKAKETDLKTIIGGNELIYPVLGIADEAGEILGKIKKLFRDHKGELTDDYKKAISKELGDILWYIAITADRLNIKLGDIAEQNAEKLAARKEKGTLRGSGDER